MDPSGVKRRLTCILAADAVGYSGQMGVDEEGTARVLAAHRAVIDGIIAFHNGRILNTAGDSVLAEFASVVEAVRCAVEIQDALKTRNDALPEPRRMLFRIGVNLGDVMVKNDDLLGDGVNVAARLEGIAEPGGICVSSSVYDQITGKLDLGFLDIGDQNLKNISRPIHAYRVSGAASRPASVVVARAPATRKPLAMALIVLAAVAVAAVAAWQAGWVRLGGGSGTVASAPTQAQSETDRLRAEAESLKQQAEAQLAQARSEVEAGRAAKAKTDADAAAAKVRAQAEADAARIRAEAAATLARAKADAESARVASAEAAKAAPPVSKASVAASVPTADSTRLYDGTWNVTIVCMRHADGAQGFTRELVAQVKEGFLRAVQGTEGSPNWLQIQGPIAPDGSALLRARGITGDPKYNVGGTAKGVPFAYTVAARFDGSSGIGRRQQTRACDLRFVKQ